MKFMRLIKNYIDKNNIYSFRQLLDMLNDEALIRNALSHRWEIQDYLMQKVWAK